VSARQADRPVVVTGGCGFIGCNLADSLLSEGERVLVLDDLSRAGVGRNLAWLRERHGDRIEAAIADVRDAAAVARHVGRARAVFHLAAQAAVTASLADPRSDFEVNALGTLNVLEAARRSGPVPVIFASTNKVYGSLEDVETVEGADAHRPADGALAATGIGESRKLDFHTPYGCSKGVADQYVLDYARSYGLPAAVLRMSCIYGPRQLGTEDQGWVAHFLIRALQEEEITIYGDGRQVRDLLFVDDLVEAFLAASRRMEAMSGHAFNIGGGPGNVFSLLEMIQLIGQVARGAPPVAFAEPRPSDQLYYVSDTRKFQKLTGWRPRVGVKDGVSHLHAWLKANRSPRRVERREAAG
jgi:CDP-paratose 2-epimerase